MADEVEAPAKAAKRKGRGVSDEVMDELAAGQAKLLDEPSAVTEPEPGALDAAIESLGKSVAREAGAFDTSEEAHVSAIDRMEGLATDFEVAANALIPDVRDFLLEQIKARPKPWSATSNGEQTDVAAACEHAGRELVRKIVEAVAASGKNNPIRCLLVGYTDKGDDIKVDLKVKALSTEETTKAVLGLHEAKGKHVLLTVASVDDFRGDGREADVQPDEPALDFEAGGNLDLAGEDDEEGETVAVCPTLAQGERVNLKSGWVQRVKESAREEAALSEDDWEDAREATPDELAFERDRVADFDE